MILIAGEASRNRFGRNALQDGSAHGLDALGITRSISKRGFELSNSDAAVSTLLYAIRLAESPLQGPVVLTLPADVGSASQRPTSTWIPPLTDEPQPRLAKEGIPLREQAEIAEKAAIRGALAATGGNKTHAARLLQIDYKTLYTKIRRYGVGS